MNIKPTALKVLQGTDRKDRINIKEPKPEIGIPTCPYFLSTAAKNEWNRIAPELEGLGLVSELDRAALAGYCELYARWGKALRKLKKHGEVKETPNGSVQVSPWLSIARSAEREMRLFMGEFGMTPCSRTKVSGRGKKKKADPSEKYFK